MLDSPTLADQNMICGSNTDHFPRIHLDVSLFSGIHQICIPTFPFDPPTQRDTYGTYTTHGTAGTYMELVHMVQLVHIV